MSVPRKKTVFIVDAKAFRRARAESFLGPWARNEQVQLISLDPDEAHVRLVGRSECDMLIYIVGAPPALEIFSEIQVLHTLRREAALAIVTDDENPATIVAAIRSGAQGYFSNSMLPDLALQALSFVLHGGTYFPPTAITAGRTLGGASLTEVPPPELQHQPSAADSENCEQQPSLFEGTTSHLHCGSDAPVLRTAAEFTERQYAVLICLCQGDPNKVIGRKLGLTETTVKVHVREIMRKLGVSNRTQVAIAVARSGVVAEGAELVPSDTPIIIKSSVPQ